MIRSENICHHNHKLTWICCSAVSSPLGLPGWCPHWTIWGCRGQGCTTCTGKPSCFWTRWTRRRPVSSSQVWAPRKPQRRISWSESQAQLHDLERGHARGRSCPGCPGISASCPSSPERMLNIIIKHSESPSLQPLPSSPPSSSSSS